MEPIVWLAIIFEGGFLLLAFVLGWWFNYPPFEQIRLSGQTLVWGILATFPLLFIMGYCTRSRSAPLRRLLREVKKEIVPLFAGCSTLQLALVAILAGVGEEALFRGVIQAGLSELIHPWLALTATSALFGLGHWITPTYAILAGIIGGYLGVITMASNNLLVAILAHALYDFAALVYLKRLL
jgi:membrane protease YdiL (CAAX protease family)